MSKPAKPAYRIEVCDLGVWTIPICCPNKPKRETATFALGPFYFSEAQFGCAPGVMKTTVGFCGGKFPIPSYDHVGDHTEAIDIEFDTSLTNFRNLLEMFWLIHDPTVLKNRRHKSAIFYHSERQRCVAIMSKMELEESLGKTIRTQILPFEKFYDAEHYHQKYVLQTYHRVFYKSLDYSEEMLKNSREAARINGYVGGYGTVEAFNKEYLTFGLTCDGIDYVRKMFWP